MSLNEFLGDSGKQQNEFYSQGLTLHLPSARIMG